MKKVLLIGALFMFAAVNFCSAQAAKIEVKQDADAVEATSTVQPAAELEKIDSELKMAEDAIKQAQDKQSQKRDELKKQFEAGLIDEATLKEKEEELDKVEANLQKAHENFKEDAEKKRAELQKEDAMDR